MNFGYFIPRLLVPGILEHLVLSKHRVFCHGPSVGMRSQSKFGSLNFRRKNVLAGS